MKVAGQATLHAPVEQVWAALNDPAVLVRTIPGCQRLEATGPDAYAMTVTAGVASIRGSYAGTVQLAELQHPHSFVMRAAGAGAPGTVSADVQVRLVEVGGLTELSYDAEAVVGGVIGGVGQRMLVGVAKKLAGEFFAGVDEVLSGEVPSGGVLNGSVPGGAVPVAATAVREQIQPTGQVPVVQPRIFTAPAGRVSVAGGEAGKFMLGAVFGAAAALLGVLVGARTARSGRRK